MSSCSCHSMRFSFLFAMVVMLGLLWNSQDVQAQSTGGKPSILKKWTFTTKDRVHIGNPVTAGDAVYFNTFNDHLIALDAATGRLRWTFDPGTGKKYSDDDFLGEAGSFPAPAVLGDQVFFASHDGCLYAVDAKTGQRKWRFVSEKALPSEPVASNGKVFFGTIEGDMYAIDAATGFKKWSVNIPGEVSNIASPTLGAGVVFFTSLFGPSVNAFDIETGRERWRWKDGDDSLCQGSSIVSAGYRVYLGSGMCGKLSAFESLTGKLVWDVKFPARENDPIAFLNDAALETVLVSGPNSILYALSAATGKEKWRTSRGAFQGWGMNPTIAKGTVFYLANGNLNAVEEDTGKNKWSLRLDSLNPPTHNSGPYDRNMLYLSDGTIYLIAPDNSLTAYSMQ
jgi:outer membrane protein assembly factor BamB